MDQESTFRQAVPREAPLIMQIIRQAQARMRAAGSSQWQDGYPAPGHISADIGRGCGYVLCRPGVRECRAIIAYGAVAFDGEPAYEALEGEWLTDGPYVVVHRMAVADGECGKGVAAEFLRHAEEMARERGIGTFRIPCCGCSNAWDSPSAERSSTGAANGWRSRRGSERESSAGSHHSAVRRGQA